MRTLISVKQNSLPSVIGILVVQFLLMSSVALAQSETVSGTVTDSETGETLPGVNIVVKGTTMGTSSDTEGSYELSVPSLGDTLVFSFVGFQTEEVPINSRTEVNVSLSSRTIMAEDVVVIGYGTQQRENVTGSVSSVPMEDISGVPTSGIDQAITGKVAGVQVNSVSGVPGGGPTIRIRGVGSIGAGNDPLFVVDGFPIQNSPDQRTNPLNSIPPSQIESVEILKDASATAIYGSRGANGVIIITTKQATPNTQIEINSSVGLQDVRRRGMEKVLNAREFAQLRKETIEDGIRFNEGREPTDQDIPEAFRNPEQLGEGTNFRDEILQNAIMNEHDFTVSGGSEDIRASLSGNYLGQEGTIIGTDYTRYSVRLNVDANLSEKLKTGINIAPSLEEQALATTDGDLGRTGAFASSFLVNPISPARNEDGSLIPMIDGPGLLAFPNPLQQLNEVDFSRDNVRTLVNTFIEYEIMESLRVKSTFNVDWSNRTAKRFKPSTVGSFNLFPPTETLAFSNDLQITNWLNENTVNYVTTLGSDHSIDGVAGFSIQKEIAEFSNFNARNFPDDKIQTFNAAQNIDGSTNSSEWSLLSYFGRINYAFKDKYLFNGTIRSDGSSRFGSDNRWGIFPSFSIGWRISDDFMQDVEPVDNLLLKFGYGESGNFNIGNYTHLGTLSQTNAAFNSAEVAGRSITNIGNPNLGWERSTQLNTGFDLSLFQSRLNFSAEYYHTVTEDMLLGIETPLTSGFSEATVNSGEVTNQGVEFVVNASIIQNDAFNWNINFNISHNSNEVTKLDNAILSPTSTAEHITIEGEPIGSFYGFVVDGFFESFEEIENSPIRGDEIPGSFKHRDINGDGRIDPIQDFGIIGNPYPDFTWGLSQSLRYKNFDLALTVTGSHGGETLQVGAEDFHNLDGVFNVSTDALDRWKSPEDPGDGIIPRAISTVIHRFAQSTWVEDNSTIWVRDITLGHTFDSDNIGFLSALGADNLRAYLNVHNAWISNTNFQNPEEEQFPNNPLQPGQTRNLNHPISRIFTLGINIKI